MVFLIDSIAAFLVFLLAYLLRFNFDPSAIDPVVAVRHGFFALSVFALFSLIFRSYSGLLRRTTLTDIMLVFLVTAISSISLILITSLRRIFGWDMIYDIPISIILIHYVTITVVLFFVRVLIKIVFRFATSPLKNTKNMLIYGAGELGVVVKGIILSDPKCGYNVKGFIDNDRNLIGKKINGVSVYPESVLSKEFLTKNSIESLILADKEILIEQKSKIIRKAISFGLEVLETPEVDKWLEGQSNARHFERVKLEDLLSRDPIKLNTGLIKENLQGKTILISGAAGSIGSEIARQLSRFNSVRVILVDQAETPLFHLDKDLREKFADFRFDTRIGDVTNMALMNEIFREFLPDIVFHAAAYKHVSLMEENPHEAIRVNVGGTKVMTELSMKYCVDKFVMISTDKAVNPTSVMGTSKRLCEQIVQSMSQIKNRKTQFIITRFGNVLGSNGSVVPLFSKQIQAGGPVTVTHPEVYRYFMTIPEACQLVLEAGIMGKGGEIFVFDMGEPVKIADMAANMIMLSGFTPGKEIKIVYTGLRPGEKLYEELLTDKETTLPTYHPRIKIAKAESIDGVKVLARIDLFLDKLYELSNREVVLVMKDMVLEYVQSNIDYERDKFKKEESSDYPSLKYRLIKELGNH